jgi:tetratricopeptide (TPR) repeat protein
MIPAEGLLCFHRLKALSRAGLMLLSADKGDHRLDELERREAPEPARHGSFSLGVNYHAIKAHVEQSGGLALFPDAHHNSIKVSCCLILPEALEHLEVRQAYRRHVAEFGPDDFSTIVTHSQESVPRMTLQQIMVYLRLAEYDSEIFARVLLRLIELAPDFNQTQRSAFVDAVGRVWDLYFPMGEKMNLANGIGCLLFNLNEYALALRYFETSIATHGENAGELVNVALCCDQLKQWEKARLALEKVLASDPGNASALELMETCAAHEKEWVTPAR